LIEPAHDHVELVVSAVRRRVVADADRLNVVDDEVDANHPPRTRRRIVDRPSSP
jgi:hypothetical protein